MIKEFVPYEQAVALKELGFDEPCLMKIWWLNDSNIYTKEQFEPHITMNGNDIKFKYQLPISHPLNKGSVLNLEIPTFSQAFRFFREKYKLQPSVNSFCFEEYSFNVMGGRNEILYPIQHKLLNDGKKIHGNLILTKKQNLNVLKY